MLRKRFVVRGQVQGVGFRPFVFTLAEEQGLTGFVRNSPQGVVIEVQGKDAALDAFVCALEHRLPPLARITSLSSRTLSPLTGETAFVIARSTEGATHAVLISPDTATCVDCQRDMADPANRRYQYPFTNCTNCGPRYTITRSIPYDRSGTSMACFALCPDCRAEYENPRNRRFHAQPNACPVCGPLVRLVLRKGACPPLTDAAVPGAANGAGYDCAFDGRDHAPAALCLPDELYEAASGDTALAALARFLDAGGIAAVKGLGGFHLACDACDDAAVRLLRERKHRPHKPFAVMAANLDEARRVAHIGPEEEALLLSHEHPIVICSLRGADAAPQGRLSALVSPDTRSVGIMLPYTPLHTVLFEHLAACRNRRAAQGEGAVTREPVPAVLVMTSGNPGGEPICLGNREALARLGEMADAFLLHNRDILIRVDDSVVRHLPGHGPLFYRRARGYVPRPIAIGPAAPDTPAIPDIQGTTADAADNATAHTADAIPGKASGNAPHHATGNTDAAAPCVLGAGAELKNTLCLTKGDDAFVSQHIGDMSNLETASFHAEIREHLAGLLKVRPTLIVRDLHPDYLSSRLAEDCGTDQGLPVRVLQHHFAHAHAVLAEHAFRGRALVLALDGTGLGEDGLLWGGEFLYVDSTPGRQAPEHRRLAHLAPLDLPGGEAAIRQPWRIAHALLLRLKLLPDEARPLPWLPEHAATAALLPAMLARRVNTPASTSLGRFFDAVSALLGLCNVTSYEGQAAIRLEEAQFADLTQNREEAWLTDLDRNAPRTKKGLPPMPFPLFPAGTGADGPPYPCPVRQPENGPLILDTHVLFAALAAESEKGIAAPVLARRFHRTLVFHLAGLAARLAGELDVTHVGLSGGCLQNRTLALALPEALREHGLIPLLHRDLPPGDGCISLGQAAFGRLLRN